MSKIFLVEDDDYLGRVYDRAFRFAGFDIEIAKDGEAGLQMLSSAPELPAAVLLDIYLPKMNGHDLLVALRKDERYASVPIIMLTNSMAANNADDFLSAGADAYLVKIEHPAQEIVDSVTEIIQKGRGVAKKT